MVQLDTEWTIVGDAKSWMDALLDAHGDSAPFSRVKLEQRTTGSLKRRDLTVLDRSGRVCLTGEVKVPYASDGASPFVETTVRDARSKAVAAGSPWFFTWNLNELVLWKTDSVGDLRSERGFKSYTVTSVRRRLDLDSPKVERELRDGIERFLLDFMRLFTGRDELPRRPPDEYFIHAFDSFLVLPIANAYAALLERDKTRSVNEALSRWMRDEQGWTLVGDRAALLRNAAKFAVYGVANKLVFYDALRKRFTALPPLRVDEAVDSGDALIDRFAAFFDQARIETGDYETIFGPVAADTGARIPFYDDIVVASWRQFAEQIDRFDLSKLDYDVIGRIFERLIDPAERHKYGQYYTRPEVVDLINAFAIREGTDAVLDPGCGGGTFLVRAYARKRRLAPRLSHAELLEGIYGTDLSPFAANLSTINLATRDLVEDANYPRVARKDFFDVARGAPLLTLPSPGGGTHVISMPTVQAVVGNPPYVRQEDVPQASKARYYGVAKSGGLDASGRSDPHVYFWGHALSLLAPGGRLGFLASSQWLDAEYGFPLQAFLLENFRIEAIIESRNEPWFVGARVATVATLAVREADPAARDDNLVRFVELARPIADLLANDGTLHGPLEAAERLRDTILACTADADFEGWRVRVERQGDMRARGVVLGQRLKGKAVYGGDKWGIPLRSPAIWKRILNGGGAHWKALWSLADVRFGIKSGADSYFYLTDDTADALAHFSDDDAFEDNFRVERVRVATDEVAIVKDGDGVAHAIERQYLRPIVHSIMAIDSYRIERRHCRKLALFAPTGVTDELVARYIAFGERNGVNTGATCRQRGRARGWYDLTPEAEAADVLWVKERQYRFAALYNPEGYAANCRLYTVKFRHGIDAAAQAAVLNSSVAILSTLMYGRPVGVEAAWSTMVLDANMLMLPSVEDIDPIVRKRLVDAHEEMMGREIVGVLSDRRLQRKRLLKRSAEGALAELIDETEFDKADRQKLDDAVLELIGFKDKDARMAARADLYAHLRAYFEDKRFQEEQGQDNRQATASSGTLSAEAVAADVVVEIERDYPALRRTYADLVRGSADGDGTRIPANGEPEVVNDLATLGVRFGDTRTGTVITARTPTQAELIAAIAKVGPRGHSVFVPREGSRATELTEQLRRIASDRQRVVRELVEARTIDGDIVERSIARVLKLLLVPQPRAKQGG